MLRRLACRRQTAAVVCVLFLITPAVLAHARYCEDWSQTMRLVTLVPEVDMPNGCQVVGDWLYGIGPNSFVVASLANPTAPRFCARLDGLPPINDLVATETHAYLACADSTLRVIDVSVPASPREMAALTVSAAPKAVTSYGGLVALAGEGRFWLVDVALVPVIEVMGETETIEATDLATKEHYALVTGVDGIATIELLNVASPHQIALFQDPIYIDPWSGDPLHPEFDAISIEGDRAALGGHGWVWVTSHVVGWYERTPGLFFVDVTDPAAISHITWDQRPARWAAHCGDVVVVAPGYWGLTAFAPETLTLAGGVPMDVQTAGRPAWQAPLLYCPTESSGLAVIDLTYPRSVLPLGVWCSAEDEWPIDCSVDYAVSYRMLSVSSTPPHFSARHYIYDLRDPVHPVLRRYLTFQADLSISFFVEAIRGDFVCVRVRLDADDRLYLWNMAPATPVWVSLPYVNALLRLAPHVAWIKTQENRLLSVDCDHLPAAPVLADVALPSAGGQFVLGTSRACIAAGTELLALGLWDRTAPVVGGMASLPEEAGACAIEGERAFLVGAQSPVLMIVDMTDVMSPALISAMVLPSRATSITVDRAQVIVGYAGGGLQVVSIENPAQPSFQSSVFGPTSGGGVGSHARSDNLLYVDDGLGITLFDLRDLAHPELIGHAAGYGAPLHLGEGLIAARGGTYPLDCFHPLPVLVSDLTLRERGGAVWLTWRSPLGAAFFRVEARRPGATWSVPVTTAGQELQARDSSENVAGGGEITYTLFAQQDDGWQQVAQTTITLGGVPSAIALHGAFPNPFNPGTTVRFALDRAREVELAVHDLRGRRAAIVAAGRFTAGEHEVAWDGRGAGGAALASGQYVLRLVIDGGVVTRSEKLVLLR